MYTVVDWIVLGLQTCMVARMRIFPWHTQSSLVLVYDIWFVQSTHDINHSSFQHIFSLYCNSPALDYYIYIYIYIAGAGPEILEGGDSRGGGINSDGPSDRATDHSAIDK